MLLVHKRCFAIGRQVSVPDSTPRNPGTDTALRPHCRLIALQTTEFIREQTRGLRYTLVEGRPFLE